MSAIRTFCSAYLDFSLLRRFDFSTFPSLRLLQLLIFTSYSRSLYVVFSETPFHDTVQSLTLWSLGLEWKLELWCCSHQRRGRQDDHGRNELHLERKMVRKGKGRGMREGRKVKEEGKQRCWSNSSDLLFRKTLGIFLRRLPFFLSENSCSHLKQQTMLCCHRSSQRR